MDQELLLLAELPPLLRSRIWKWTRVSKDLNALHLEVSDTGNVHLGALTIIGAAEVAVDGDGPVTLASGLPDLLSRSEVLEAVGEHVRMCVAEHEGAELHHGDEAGEVEDLGVGVPAVQDAREVEEFGPLIDLRPEAFLQGLFGVLQGGGLLDEVEVGEYSDDLRKPMRLQDVEELESFLYGRERGTEDQRRTTYHLETVRAVDHEQDEVRNLPDVDHGVEVVIAFDEGEALLLPADDGDGPMNVVQSLLGVPPNEGLHERGLADAGRANHGDDDGRRLVIGCAVDEWDMETCLVALCSAAALLVCSPARFGCKSL